MAIPQPQSDFSCAEEAVKDFVPLEFGHVFHGDDVGLHLAHEAGKLVEQGPLGVIIVVEALGVFGEGLTRRAADEDARVARRVMRGERGGLEVGDADFLELDSLVVVFVWEAAGFIHVVAGRDLNPGIKQAARETACATEEVDGGRMSDGR